MSSFSPQLTPIPIESVDGFCFGHWTDVSGGTGCTAIVAPAGATGGVDVRGGAPASRETDLLRPEETVSEVHAVMLSGGSAYGLEAASGAARELERQGIGLPVGVGIVPIVCSACLFDLSLGDSAARPDIEAGEKAVAAALEADGPLAEGSVGAGMGATVGKIAGPDRTMKGGIGAQAFQLGPLKVGAIAAVNACGDVVDPTTLRPIAGVRAAAESHELLSTEELLLDWASQPPAPLDNGDTPGNAPAPRSNTTISCVVTNAHLTKAQVTKVAQIAADAYAHCIRPTHTTNDGDTIFVLASGTLPEEVSAALPLDIVGLVATRALEAAIVAGVTKATGAFGTPAVNEL